jgi:chromate transporter
VHHAANHPGLAALFLYFLRAGVSVFGSGYVLLAILQRDLVERRGWLSLPALTQASALAQITPGPLFTTATGAGYAIAGSAGAALATVGIFAPAFLSLAVGARVRRLVERSAVTRAALDGVVMASVALLGRALVGFGMPLHAWQWLISVLAVLVLFVRRGWETVLLLTAMSVGIVSLGLHVHPA